MSVWKDVGRVWILQPPTFISLFGVYFIPTVSQHVRGQREPLKDHVSQSFVRGGTSPDLWLRVITHTHMHTHWVHFVWFFCTPGKGSVLDLEIECVAFFALLLTGVTSSPSRPPSSACILVAGSRPALLPVVSGDVRGIGWALPPHLLSSWSLHLWLGTGSPLAQGHLSDRLGGLVEFVGMEYHTDVANSDLPLSLPRLRESPLLARPWCGRSLLGTWGLPTCPGLPPPLLRFLQDDLNHSSVLCHPVLGFRTPQMMLTV